MKLPISDRLLACCEHIAPGSRVADVGCDHGYLAIHLLTTGTARSVIAADIKEGPLRSAVVNAEKYGVRENIAFYLSDGAKSIPRDFDTLVCAGMGGDTMVSILEASPWLQSEKYRLVLQCQSKTPMLCQYLTENGWRITEETALKDGRFVYTVMEVYYQPDYPKLSAVECYFPPALMENPSEFTAEYYRRILDGLQIAATHQNDTEKAALLRQLLDLAETPELSWLKGEGK